MSTEPRRLHSVPTGPDVVPGHGTFPVDGDVDSETPTDTQALMRRIVQSGKAELLRASRRPEAVNERIRADHMRPHHPQQ